MSALEGEHNPGTSADSGTEGDVLLTMQVFHVEDNSCVEGRCGKSKHVQTTVGSDKAVWHEKETRPYTT